MCDFKEAEEIPKKQGELKSRLLLGIEANFFNTTENQTQSPLLSFTQNPVGWYMSYMGGMRAIWWYIEQKGLKLSKL